MQGTQEIDPSEITICQLEDGRPWLLGSGSFGQVRLRCASRANVCVANCFCVSKCQHAVYHAAADMFGCALQTVHCDVVCRQVAPCTCVLLHSCYVNCQRIPCHAQVFKGLRRDVQEVAVKKLLPGAADDSWWRSMQKVCCCMCSNAYFGVVIFQQSCLEVASAPDLQAAPVIYLHGPSCLISGDVPQSPCNIGLAAILQEIGVLQKVSYDRNIVQYYGACLTAEQPMLIMEFCAVRLCRSSVLGQKNTPSRSSDHPGTLASPVRVCLFSSIFVAAESLKPIACTAGRRSKACFELG